MATVKQNISRDFSQEDAVLTDYSPKSLAKKLREERILELQKMIQDESYIDNAVERIADVISKKIVESRLENSTRASLVIQ